MSRIIWVVTQQDVDRTSIGPVGYSYSLKKAEKFAKKLEQEDIEANSEEERGAFYYVEAAHLIK